MIPFEKLQELLEKAYFNYRRYCLKNTFVLVEPNFGDSKVLELDGYVNVQLKSGEKVLYVNKFKLN